MTKKTLTPKYITEEVCKIAVDSALNSVFGSLSPLRNLPKRNHCHIVVLVPAMKDARAADYPDWPVYPVDPFPIYERSVLKPSWEHPYDDVAKCKALQLWTDRNDDRTANIPHLLFPGDTPYWGGVKRRGIVVTCSGVQPWFDKMISGIVADTIVALAHDAYVNDEEKDGVDFLS